MGALGGFKDKQKRHSVMGMDTWGNKTKQVSPDWYC